MAPRYSRWAKHQVTASELHKPLRSVTKDLSRHPGGAN
jgi:hypothetical protein